nr:hypothetical protein [Tanacetum cinerariifolium]
MTRQNRPPPPPPSFLATAVVTKPSVVTPPPYHGINKVLTAYYAGKIKLSRKIKLVGKREAPLKPPLRYEPNHHRKEIAKTHGYQKRFLRYEEKQKSMDIESLCAAAATVVETDVTTWSSLPTAAVTAVSHYNINHIPQRYFGAFPSDLSLGNLRWRMLDRDTFPSDNPQRNCGSHIFFSQAISATVANIPRRHIAGDCHS